MAENASQSIKNMGFWRPWAAPRPLAASVERFQFWHQSNTGLYPPLYLLLIFQLAILNSISLCL